jgi:hypothetical protein
MNGSHETAATDARVDWNQAIRALLLAWLIPGGGHFLLRRHRRAVAFFVIVLVSFVIGLGLATLACLGVGAPYVGMRFLVGYAGDPLAPGFEYGSAFILTAGLMNILLVLDVWDIARGRKE